MTEGFKASDETYDDVDHEQDAGDDINRNLDADRGLLHEKSPARAHGTLRFRVHAKQERISRRSLGLPARLWLSAQPLAALCGIWRSVRLAV